MSDQGKSGNNEQDGGDPYAPSPAPDSGQQQQGAGTEPSKDSSGALARNLNALKDRIGLTDVVMLLATIVIAGATVWNVFYVKGQLDEMKGGAAQTDSAIKHIAELAGQTKRQADALQNQLGPLRDEAQAAQAQVGILSGELSQMKLQTNASQTAAGAAVGQLLEMRNEQRPQIEIATVKATQPLTFSSVGAIFWYQFDIKNTGRSVSLYTIVNITFYARTSDDALRRQQQECAKAESNPKIRTEGFINPSISIFIFRLTR